MYILVASRLQCGFIFTVYVYNMLLDMTRKYSIVLRKQ